MTADARPMLTDTGSRRRRPAWRLIGVGLVLIVGVVAWFLRPSPPAVLSPITPATALHLAVDCASIERRNLLVVVVLGQSNAANHGQTRGGPVAHVYGFHDGRCHVAADPLPGASGDAGSVWMRLAPRLLQPGQVDAVLLVPLAVNSTSIAQWNQHPILRAELQRLAAQLQLAGLRPGMVLWHQGEADSFAQTSGDAYRQGFAQLLARLRGLGVDAPVWVARATRCQARSNPAVYAVQAELPSLLAGVRAGPDLDRLFDAAHRYDGCHFSTDGLEAAALAWWLAIAQGQSTQGQSGGKTE